MKTAPFPA